MSRLKSVIARLPVGWTSVTLLLAMAVVQLSWPGERVDRLPDAALAPTSLALDRLQLRLTSQMLSAAVERRSADSQSYQSVVNQMRMLEGHLPVRPEVARLWAADVLFSPQQAAPAVLPVRSLVLVYERVRSGAGEAGVSGDGDDWAASLAAGRAGVGEGRRVALADGEYGRAWGAMETLVAGRASDDGRLWHVRATTPVLSATGRVVGLAEVEYVWPRRMLWPQWPRWAMLAILGGLLAVVVELRDATVRRLLRGVGIKVSTAVLSYEAPASRAEEAMAGRIKRLASRAEDSNRHWLLREVPPREARSSKTEIDLPEGIRLPLRGAAAEAANDPGETARVARSFEGERVLAAAVIEDERLLASVLEMLLPHVGPGEVAGHLAAGDVSLRVTIEICRRAGTECGAKGVGAVSSEVSENSIED